MTISPEQFNKLATKEDLKDFATKDHLDNKIGEVLNSVDGIAKRLDTIETEFKADKIAHDRIQEDVDNIKERLELKTTP